MTVEQHRDLPDQNEFDTPAIVAHQPPSPLAEWRAGVVHDLDNEREVCRHSHSTGPEYGKLSNERGIDRRAVFRKAAVAGTLVWTAPLVMQSKAAAATACTPSCAPPPDQQPQIQITASRSCVGDAADTRVWRFVGLISASIIGCPCGSQAAIEVVSPAVGTIIATVPVNQPVILTVPIVVRISCLNAAGTPIFRSCAGVTETNYTDTGACVETARFTFPSSTSTPCNGAPTCN